MSPVALVVLLTLLAALGLAIAVAPIQVAGPTGRPVPILGVTTTDLVVLRRGPREHLVILSLAGCIGAVLPPLTMGAGKLAGVVSLGVAIPAASAVLGSMVAVALAIRSTRDGVREARMALRHQLTAYVDMVTMLVAGDNGHEAALEQAATVGEGLLFEELRRHLREQSTRGGSLVEALEAVADRLGLDELRQVASAVSLAGTEGAPVVRSLSARAGSLRSSLAAEQEIEARLRTSRLTGPIVGMALIFMVLVIYPALSISPA